MPETLAMTELRLHKKGEEGGSRGRRRGGAEPELTASELIHPLSSPGEWRCAGAREREREGEGGGTEREEYELAAERMRDGDIAAAQQ